MKPDTFEQLADEAASLADRTRRSGAAVDPATVGEVTAALSLLSRVAALAATIHAGPAWLAGVAAGQGERVGGVDSTQRWDHICRHCGLGIDFVGGVEYQASGGYGECAQSPTGHEPLDDRRQGPTMTAGQLAAWFSGMPPDRPVIGYSGYWYLNIESLDFVIPEEGTALVISLANDFDTRQW